MKNLLNNTTIKTTIMRRAKKSLSLLLAIVMLTQGILPTSLKAMTGPIAPEFSSFESVSTSGMVNEFTGDFNYNLPVIEIPGANGGGYAMSLTYNSNLSPDEDASWVGYGFNLSPGAIVRNKAGFPDDVSAGPITRSNTNNTNTNLALEVPVGAATEGYCVNASLGVTNILQYNNLTGFSYQAIPEASITGGPDNFQDNLGLSISRADGDWSFSPIVKPAALFDDLGLWEKALNNDHYLLSSAFLTMSDSKGADLISNCVNSQGVFGNYASRARYSNGGINGIQTYTGWSVNLDIAVGSSAALPFQIDGSVGVNSIGASASWQNAEASQDFICYGFLHSHEAADADQEKVLMDFSSERDDPFTKKINYLSASFSQQDEFSVFAEGLGGTFKAYAKNLGEFHRNKAVSNTYSFSGGVDLGLGADLKVGGSVGLGYGRTVFDTWESTLNDSYKNEATADEAYAFVFDGDLGSYISYGNDEAEAASIENEPLDALPDDLSEFCSTNSIPTSIFEALLPNKYEAKIPSSISPTINSNDDALNGLDESTSRIPRSSYVGYHTNLEMEKVDANGNYYNRYTPKSVDTDLNIYRGGITGDFSYDLSNQIGEFFITNPAGSTYVYGVPVYNLNEINDSYVLNPAAYSDGKVKNKDGVTTSTDLWVKTNAADPNYVKSQMGEKNNFMFASTFLLTQITNSDFIDRDNNGADEGDFGGWTRFEYKNLNDLSNLYHYRKPYSGFLHDVHSLSSDKDNTVSYSSGDREVKLLKKVVTNTHTAVFYTSAREDANDAYSNDLDAGADFSKKGSNQLQKLDSIVLYANDDDNATDPDLTNNTIVKRVYFEYDYSLMPDNPSNTGNVVLDKDGVTNLNANKGKLTLKRFWTEYEDVRNSKISPYEFVYTYPTTSNSTLENYANYPSHLNADGIDEYAALENYADVDRNGTSDLSENPSYSPYNTNVWGSYQADGEDRYNNMRPWVNQAPDAGFDAGAYLLKMIKLPSGGQIHVQYEQDDYAYVQDQPAHAMVSIQSIQDGDDNDMLNGTFEDKYYLNLNDIGIDGSDLTEVTEVRDLIKERYVDGGKKIYGKFLYALNGDATSGISTCPAEYIDFYATVKDVIIDGTQLYLKLGRDGLDEYAFPRNVCKDYVDANRSGILNTASCSVEEPIDLGITSAEGLTLDVATAGVYELLQQVGTTFVTDASTCKKISETDSYFRIPLPSSKPKKGGGVRVKRLLTYDAGLETADAKLYGQEFSYKTNDGSSSGVATNEPGGNDNILVDFIDGAADQSILEKIVAGIDKTQYEGPIGQGVLPGPSVGYSKVISKNINSGSTAGGFGVSEFFTSKDYPLNFTKSYIDPQTNAVVTVKGVNTTPIYQESKEPIFGSFTPFFTNTGYWNTQGFSFIQTDMNGKTKKQATYSGSADDLDNAILTAGSEYTYFEPGEAVKVVDDQFDWSLLENGSTQKSSYRTIGKQMDVTMESRDVKDFSIYIALELDLSIGLVPAPLPPFVIPIPQGALLPAFNGHYDELATHTITKVVHYPSIVKSVKKTVDGVSSYAINDFFNGKTGEAMVTKTYDAYNGLNIAQYASTTAAVQNGTYTSFTFPASPYYTDLGGKSLYDNKTLTYGLNGVNYAKNDGYLEVTGDECSGLNNFTPGDLIAIDDNSTTSDDASPELYNVGEISGNKIELLTNSNFANSTNEYTAVNVNIVKTGKTNQLAAAVGSLVTYGNPVANIHSVKEQVGEQEWAIREDFASALNTEYLGMTAGSSVSASYSYANLNVTDATGNCVPLSTTVSISNSLQYVPYTYTEIVGMNGAAGYHEEAVEKTDYKWILTGTLSTGQCTSTFTIKEGYLFYIDEETGELMYGEEDNDCDAIRIDCIDFCPDYNSYTTLTNVVSASAINLSDEWTLDNDIASGFDFVSDENKYQTAAAGKWRPAHSFDYNTTLTNATDANNYVYGAGIYPDTFKVFEWGSQANEDWSVLNTTDAYSPNGVLIQKTNPLEVSSVMKTINDNMLPGLVAANVSTYANVMHEGFESAVGSGVNYIYENGYEVSQYNAQPASDQAHSGDNSIQLKLSYKAALSYTASLPLSTLIEDNQLTDNGFLVKLWVRSNAIAQIPAVVSSGTAIATSSLSISLSYPSGSSTLTKSLDKVTQVGEWSLYQVEVTDANSTTKKIDATINFTTNNLASSPYIYVDDLRIQPIDAQVNAYVYDKATYKILAQLNDQNLGLFYQYDDEGKLISKQVETERGLKTVTEASYNMPLKDR